MFEKMKSPVTGALLLASSLAGEELPEVLVEANRIETRREDTGSAVTVLSGDWLRDVGIRDLDRSFDTVPGALMLSEGGRAGSISTLRLRGSESDHVQIMVDGVRINDANMSGLNFLGQEGTLGYSRATILRGPQSALYGSGAIGGVLFLETARGGEEENGMWMEAGSFSSLAGGLRYGEK